MGCIQKNVHTYIAGVLILFFREDLFVVKLCGPPGKCRINKPGIGFSICRLHMQQDRVHDAGTELGNQEPVPEQIFLIIGMVVGNQFRLTLSLVHFKRIVNPVKFNNFALRVEEMGEFVISATKLLFQLNNIFSRID